MSENAINTQADKNLQADIERATTPDEIRELLHRAIERSPELGVTRNIVTGQFERASQPAAPDAAAAAAKAAADAAAAAPRSFKQVVKISGQDFEFVGDSAENLQSHIDSAKSVHQALADNASPARIARDAEQTTLDRVEADMMLRRGEITTAEYLQKTHAIEDYLQSQGVDTARIAGEHFEKDWAEASAAFRQNSDWPGGQKNLALLGDKLAAMGLDGTPSVESLEKAYAALKAAGTLFSGDVSQAEVEAMTDKMTPQEIIEHWRQAQDVRNGDATGANETFISTFREGRSSGIFGR